MPQQLEPFIAEALDAVPAERLPDLRMDGAPADVKRVVESELRRCGLRPLWLAEWLAENVSFQARMFAELSGAERLKLRLETVRDNGCERFHVDNVRRRLLCTYRGPGTEWLDPDATALPGREDDVPASAIHRLERGAVAIARGRRGAAAGCPALVHRSPRIEGEGVVRLLLVIDEAD